MKFIVASFLLWGIVALASDKDTLPLQKIPSSKKSEGGSIIQSTKAKVQGATPAPSMTEDEEGASKAKPYIASIESFGSSRVSEVILRELLGADLDAWIAKGLKGDPTSVDIEKKMLAKIKAKFDFALAEWSIVQYFEPGDLAIHMTLDVVEKADVAKRMAFLPQPTAELADPDGLINLWMEYEETALGLVEAGQLEPEAEACVALHCPFGHKHAQLKKYEAIFLNGVKKNEAALREIIAKDKRADHRASAAYLLAYSKDGKKVVSSMVDRIKDPDAMVRNNALRVLGDIAEFHQELVIPMKSVIEALNFPRVSDRSKALYVLYLSSLNTQQTRDEVVKTALLPLLECMTSKQPDHKEIAHGILRKVSGKDFPVTDLRSWTNWTAKLLKDGVSPAKAGVR